MKTAQIETKLTKSILRVGIDNDWWIEDFNVLFDSLSRLYSYYSSLEQANVMYDRLGTEFNWDKKIKNLPDFLNISLLFPSRVNKIFKNDIDNEESFTYSDWGFSNRESLKVHKIKFGSRGSVDLIGIGKIFEVIKDLVNNYIPNAETKVDILIKQKEIEEREQKILQLKIENLKKLGLNSNQILMTLGFEATHLDKLRKLMSKNRIIDFEIDKLDEQ